MNSEISLVQRRSAQSFEFEGIHRVCYFEICLFRPASIPFNDYNVATVFFLNLDSYGLFRLLY